MKKLCYIFAAIMTAVTILFFAGCSANTMTDVSERRCGFFYGEDDKYKVTAVSGVREEPYEPDGIVGALKSYTLITVAPINSDVFDVDARLTYEAEVTGETGKRVFGGALVVHPFAASFSAEYDYETTGETIALTITEGETCRTISLRTAVAADTISFDRAISAAKKELQPDAPFEIRAKLVRNPIDADALCWHVEFCNAETRIGVLLDAVSARVIAKKTA